MLDWLKTNQKKGSTETQKTSPSLFPHCGSCYETCFRAQNYSVAVEPRFN